MRGEATARSPYRAIHSAACCFLPCAAASGSPPFRRGASAARRAARAPLRPADWRGGSGTREYSNTNIRYRTRDRQNENKIHLALHHIASYLKIYLIWRPRKCTDIMDMGIITATAGGRPGIAVASVSASAANGTSAAAIPMT